MNGDVAASNVVKRAQRVFGRVLDLAIAVDRRAGDQLELRMQRRQHDRHRIVGARVDIEDELAPGHDAFPDR